MTGYAVRQGDKMSSKLFITVLEMSNQRESKKYWNKIELDYK